MDPEIRPATAADARGVAAVAAAAYRPYVVRLGFAPAPLGADYVHAVAEGAVWVADREGTVTGFVVLRLQVDALLLETLAVAPEHQGEGLGGRLVAFAEHHARECGRETVTLYTNEAMVRNLEWYRRLGYRETGRAEQDGFRRVTFAKP